MAHTLRYFFGGASPLGGNLYRSCLRAMFAPALPCCFCRQGMADARPLQLHASGDMVGQDVIVEMHPFLLCSMQPPTHWQTFYACSPWLCQCCRLCSNSDRCIGRQGVVLWAFCVCTFVKTRDKTNCAPRHSNTLKSLASFGAVGVERGRGAGRDVAEDPACPAAAGADTWNGRLPAGAGPVVLLLILMVHAGDGDTSEHISNQGSSSAAADNREGRSEGALIYFWMPPLCACPASSLASVGIHIY